MMGAEDFGLFSEGGVPIFMFKLGTIPPEQGWPPPGPTGEPMPSLHSALYYPDAVPSLRTGIRAMTSAVVGLLPPRSALPESKR